MKNLLLYILLACSLSLPAQSVESLFKLANQQYEQQEYEAAIVTYEKIIAQNQESVAIYYNLGNCYYKLGKLAASILNYERALVIDPNDADTQFNLSIANELTADKIDKLPQSALQAFWKSFSQMFTYEGWAYTAVGLAWIVFAAFLLYYFAPSIGLKKLGFGVSFSAFMALLLSIFISYQQREWLDSNEEAIVFAANSYVKSGPNDSSEDIFILHEGVKVRVLDEVAGWNKVRLSDGKIGWLRSEDMQKI